MAARTDSSSRPRIGISGSYGGLNLGDEAILTVAVAELRRAIDDVEIVVFSRDAEHTRTNHDVERVIPARGTVREEIVPELERLDLLLLGGGGILYDREAESYLHVVRIAQQLEIPTAAFAAGVGPLERSDERRAVADVLNRMERITVRETSAKLLLEELGVEREIEVTADPALLLEPLPFSEEKLRDEGISRERCLVAISVRERGGAAAEIEASDYHALLATAADFMADRFDADIVFVPLERQDIREAHRVISSMGLAERASVLKGEYAPRQLPGLMEHIEVAVGMRLHFLIFAALKCVPLLALPYAAKVTSLLEELGQSTPRLVDREHAGPLLASIDWVWDHRHEQRAVLAERLPRLQERARRTARAIAELLEEREQGIAAAP